MKKIKTWGVYEVQNPGDLDKNGNQKSRAFIALGRGNNPYQTYGILTTTSYKENTIEGELIIDNLLMNKYKNKLLPNNFVKIYNSNIIRPFTNYHGHILITNFDKEKIINHFNLQKYYRHDKFKFHLLDNIEKIDYNYQAKTLLEGNQKNILESRQATNNLVDKLQEMEFDTDNTVLLSKEQHQNLTDQLLKYYEGWQYAESEITKLHQKINELVKDKHRILEENKKLKQEFSLNDENILKI